MKLGYICNHRVFQLVPCPSQENDMRHLAMITSSNMSIGSMTLIGNQRYQNGISTFGSNTSIHNIKLLGNKILSGGFLFLVEIVP